MKDKKPSNKTSEKTKLDRAKTELMDAIAAVTEKLDRPEEEEFLQWLEAEARSQFDALLDEAESRGTDDEKE